MIGQSLKLFLVITCGLLIFETRLQAQERPLNLVLYTGQVVFLDHDQNRIPAVSGQTIHTSKYPYLELGANSAAFLQKGDLLFQFRSPGRFPLQDLDKQSSFSFQNAILFLNRLVKPRRFVKQARVRGDLQHADQTDDLFFDTLWEQMIEESDSEPSLFDAETYLAMAAWYRQNQQPARVAYILERLNTATRQENEFYRQLRNQSLRGITLAEINQEVTESRKRMASRSVTLRYKAMLIGIDRYDNGYWQRLENPVRDITRLGNILKRDYGLRDTDLILLKNPTFDEIVAGFQLLKQTVGPETSLLIYYAGHGYYPPEEEEGYWIPRDAGEPESLRLFLSTSTVLSKIRAIKSRHTLLIADSCFSGSLIRTSRSAAVPSRYFNELSRKKSRQIITSGGLEPVSDRGSEGHSIFAGQLIALLSKKQNEPLSASELALGLRKSVKNARYPQTPEYGRLHIADDEAGEFFFVRQDLQFVAKTVEPSADENKNQEPELRKPDPAEEDDMFVFKVRLPISEPYQLKGKNAWGHIGYLFHQATLEYNQSFQNPVTAQPDSVKIITKIEGFALRGAYRQTAGKAGYGVQFSLGQFRQLNHCADDNEFDTYNDIPSCAIENTGVQDRDLEQNLSLSGQLAQLGVFGEYTPLAWRFFSMQIGGQLQYQLYRLNNFLGEDQVTSDTLSVCADFGISFRSGSWSARIFGDFCLPPIITGGSLYTIDNASGSDARLVGYMDMGTSAGYLF